MGKRSEEDGVPRPADPDNLTTPVSTIVKERKVEADGGISGEMPLSLPPASTGEHAHTHAADYSPMEEQ